MSPRTSGLTGFTQPSNRRVVGVWVVFLLALASWALGGYIGAAIDGFAVGRIARAFARRFGTPRQNPRIISTDAIAAELGEWARGYALDQRLSGEKARRELGYVPRPIEPLLREMIAHMSGVSVSKVLKHA